jgi:hypothetical protein
MKVKLTSSVAIKGEHQEVGTVLDLSDTDGYSLIARGRAIPFSEANEISSNRAESTESVKKRAPKKKTAAR